MWSEVCHSAATGEWAAIAVMCALQGLLFRVLFQRLHKAQDAASAALLDLQYAQRAQSIQAACHERERNAEEQRLQAILDEAEVLESEIVATDNFVLRASQQRDALIASVAEMNRALEANILETEQCVSALNDRADQIEIECDAIEDTIQDMVSECASLSERAATVSMERRALSSQRRESSLSVNRVATTSLSSTTADHHRRRSAPAMSASPAYHLNPTASAESSKENQPPHFFGARSSSTTTSNATPAAAKKQVARGQDFFGGQADTSSSFVMPEEHVLVENEFQAAKKLNDFLLSEAERIWNGEVKSLIDRVSRNKDIIATLSDKMSVLQHRNDLAVEARQLLADIRLVETA